MTRTVHAAVMRLPIVTGTVQGVLQLGVLGAAVAGCCCRCRRHGPSYGIGHLTAAIDQRVAVRTLHEVRAIVVWMLMVFVGVGIRIGYGNGMIVIGAVTIVVEQRLVCGDVSVPAPVQAHLILHLLDLIASVVDEVAPAGEFAVVDPKLAWILLNDACESKLYGLRRKPRRLMSKKVGSTDLKIPSTLFFTCIVSKKQVLYSLLY